MMRRPSIKLSLLRATILVVVLQLFGLIWTVGSIVSATFIVGEGDPRLVATAISDLLIGFVLAIPSIIVFGLILWMADRFILLRDQRTKAD